MKRRSADHDVGSSWLPISSGSSTARRSRLSAACSIRRHAATGMRYGTRGRPYRKPVVERVERQQRHHRAARRIQNPDRVVRGGGPRQRHGDAPVVRRERERPVARRRALRAGDVAGAVEPGQTRRRRDGAAGVEQNTVLGRLKTRIPSWATSTAARISTSARPRSIVHRASCFLTAATSGCGESIPHQPPAACGDWR